MSDQLSHPGRPAARSQAAGDPSEAGANRSRQALVKGRDNASYRFGGFALALLGALTLSTAGQAEPFVPASDAAVLERLPAAGDPWLREQRAALAQNPDDLDIALALATAYAALGRSEGDPRYDGYAQAALAPWWDLAEPPIPVLILRATLTQRRHDFEAALVDLDQVLARSPWHPQALLTKATILGVQGKPAQALDSCADLAGSVEMLIEAACAAGAYGLGGRARDGYHLLQDALARSPGAEPVLRVWVLTILAETAAQLGDTGAAEEHFREALALERRDPYLLGAYADFLLDQERSAEVMALLEGETRIDPLLLRLALAEQRIGADRLEEHVALMQARFDAAHWRGDTVHLREEACFTLHLLDRPAEALELALENWVTQREPADARILLEAALAADAAVGLLAHVVTPSAANSSVISGDGYSLVKVSAPPPAVAKPKTLQNLHQ
jgi:tetratricopeptide (TPR) repeat protein